jgi:galactonate dehydratase
MLCYLFLENNHADGLSFHLNALSLTTQSSFFPVNAWHDTCIGPGLGIVINEELVRTRAKEYSRAGNEAWRNPIWRGEDGSIREW